MRSDGQGGAVLRALAAVMVLGCTLASATDASPVSAVATGQPQCEDASGSGRRRQVHFVPNSYRFWTDPRHATTELPEGCTGSACTLVPAFANILLQNSNFLACQGGPFALCYHSGPSTTSPGLGCTLTPNGRFANCDCYAFAYGAYFVDINSILNYGVYRKTVKRCGAAGASAPGSTRPPCARRSTGDG